MKNCEDSIELQRNPWDKNFVNCFLCASLKSSRIFEKDGFVCVDKKDYILEGSFKCQCFGLQL